MFKFIIKVILADIVLTTTRKLIINEWLIEVTRKFVESKNQTDEI